MNEFKDHVVQNPDKYIVTDNPDGTKTIKPFWVENPADILQAGTPFNAAAFNAIPAEIAAIDQKVTSQLADKAPKTVVDAAHLRIDELIIGSGNANAEVTDAHVSVVKNKTFPTIGNRLNEAEEEVAEINKDRKPLFNKVINADFSTTADWVLTGATMQVQDNKAILTATSGTARVLQYVPVKPRDFEKFYSQVKVKITSGTPTALRIMFRDWVTGGTFQESFQLTNPALNTVYELNKVFATSNFVDNVRLYVEVVFTNSVGTYEVWNPTVFNLTETYGIGEEPTQTQMLDLLNDTGFIVDKVWLNTFDRVKQETAKAITDVKFLATNQAEKEIVRAGSFTRTKKVLWTISYDDESDTILDYALPIHQAENVPAMFYIVPNRIGTGQTYAYGKTLDWDGVHELIDSGLFEIGHHTINHTQTTSLSEAALRDNIEQGFEIFHRNGVYPKHFSYPGGANNAMNRNVLRDYFVSAGATTFNANTPESFDMHPFKFDRRSCDSWFVNFQSDLDKFIANGSGWLVTYMHAIHPAGQVDGISQSTGQAITSTCWTPTQLQSMIQYAKSQGVEIVTMDEGLKTYSPFVYYFNEQVEPLYAVQRNGIVVNSPVV